MNERPRFLAMLAEEDRRAGASPRVEQVLRARVVRRKRGLFFRWNASWTTAAAAAVAAGLAFAVFLLRPGAEEKLPALQVERFSPRAPEFAYHAPTPPSPAMDEYGRVTHPARRTMVKAPAAASTAAAAPPERFYSLAYAPPELLAGGRMVRVRVPRAALLSFGLPLDAYRPAAGKIDADVIFTEDGIARAIRFVSQSQ